MLTNRKKVLAISGSTRFNSSNERILRHIEEIFKDKIEMELYLKIDSLPHFNPDLDNDKVPESVMELREKVDKSDGVLICTPEYVFSLPGSLKNALEWTVSTTVFSFKPVAIVVAAAHGQKAFESLTLIMNTLIQKEISETSKLLIQGGKGKMDATGKVMDENVSNSLKQVVNSFIHEMQQSG